MKKLTLVVTVLFVLSFVVVSLAQASHVGQMAGNASIAAVAPYRDRGGEEETDDRGRGGERGERGERGQKPGERMARHLGMMLVIAAQQDDDQIQGLIDKAFADRKKMIPLEEARVRTFESLIEGVRDGKTKDELEAEREAVKTASEKLRAAGEQLAKDLKAIKDRLDELGVKAPRQGEGRGNRGGQGDNDFPEAID